jgi:peptide deformylase
MPSSWRQLREHSLEEGVVVTPHAIFSALTDWLVDHVPWRTYVASWVFFAVVVSLREYAVDPTPEPDVTRDPRDYATLYRAVTSLPVADDMDIDRIVAQMHATADEHGFTCLAAVHIGHPLRIAFIHTFELGDTILVNPTIVPGDGGERISRGEETSAFGGEPRMMSRAFPVTVKARDGYHGFDVREDVHCIWHLLGQLDGAPFFATVS